MTEGHKHHLVRVKRGGFIHRLFTIHLLETYDQDRAEKSRLVWGRLTYDEPDHPAGGAKVSHTPFGDAYLIPADIYVLTPLSILHTFTGLTLEPR